MTEKIPQIQIYTDGACLGNPGPGGFGAVLIYGGRQKEISGGYRLTTNNRMELTAVIRGFQELKKPCHITLYSDSKYIVDAINLGWVKKWMANRWVKGDGLPAKNADLWQKLVELQGPHQVNWVWVKGHADNKYNNRCDQLAVAACKGENLAVDLGYEKQ